MINLSKLNEGHRSKNVRRALQITSSADIPMHMFPSALSDFFVCRTEERKAAVGRYISFALSSVVIYIRNYGVPLKSSVVVVVIVVDHAGPHEDALLIGRCQWFDPS